MSTTQSTTQNEMVVWKEPYTVWASLVFVVVAAVLIFQDGLSSMVRAWDGQEEYSYGYLIPFICLLLIWQKKDKLQRISFQGSWAGVGLMLLGVILFFLGQFSAVYSIVQYSFLLVLWGLTLAFVGWQAFKIIWVPLLILIFMVPLPGFLNETLSNELQLISSKIGVAVIRLFGISVFLEGNVVDLGSFQLQVVEACSGLRYLFPLMTFGFIAAYFFKAAWWKRALLFLSTIPITILMNSFRIGVIGMTVEYWGPAMAEGFLHDFEGWVIFMVCTAVLVLEMWLLARIGKHPRPLGQVFDLSFPAASPHQASVQYRSMPRAFYVASATVVIVMAVSYVLPERMEVIPSREAFVSFPMEIAHWNGRGQQLESKFIDALNFDDYLLADYVGEQKRPVNLYVGYYETQRADKVPHSPRACIPGGGWQISDISEQAVDSVKVAGHPLRVNRVLIERGDQRQLVYYWFQQRGRVITNEYLVKWYLFWDALTRSRSDGSLVRLTTLLAKDEVSEDGDHRLVDFTRLAVSELHPYLPD